MKKLRTFFGLLGLLLFMVSLILIGSAQKGLRLVQTAVEGTPMIFILPENGQAFARPLVLVGHGFAGSAQLMKGFGYTLAHAGYTVALWDFNGHAANAQPFGSFNDARSLQVNAETVLFEAERRGLVQAGRLAVAGHSMGSGVAMTFGQDFPETKATIAISPVGTQVTPELPHNLLLMAGSLEPNFVENARARLAEAGGSGGSLQDGSARALIIIPNVEHISILFSPKAHSAAREWLDATFGVQPGAVDYVDRRILWLALGVLGAVLAGAAWIPAVPAPVNLSLRSAWHRLVALVGGAVCGTLVLWLLDKVGFTFSSLFGLMVGGYLMLWFFFSGLFALWFMGTLSRSTKKAWVSGLLIFGILWVGLGLLSQWVWLPWLLIPKRLLLWLPSALLVFPWFMALGQASSPAKPAGWWGWFLVNTLVVCGSLMIAMRLTPGIGFIMLLLPMFPLIFLLQSLAAVRQRSPWVYGLGSALLTGWAILVVFPLM